MCRSDWGTNALKDLKETTESHKNSQKTNQFEEEKQSNNRFKKLAVVNQLNGQNRRPPVQSSGIQPQHIAAPPKRSALL